MCIECWWACLNETQRVVTIWIPVVAMILSYVWLCNWADDKGVILKRIIQWPGIAVLGLVVIMFVGVILYGLYGAIACLF